MADIKNIDVFQTVTSVSFEVEPNTDIININKVTTNGYSGVPNLQEVTNQGASTTNPITITVGDGGANGITSYSSQGYGIKGESSESPGVYGVAVSTGVYGLGATGVIGEGGTGVKGIGTYYGVDGNSYDGVGVLASTDIGIGVSAVSEDIGTGIYAYSTSGKGIEVYGNGTISVDVNLGSTNKGVVIDSGTSSTGNPIEVNKNGVNKLTVNQAGELTATKLIKQGGTSNQFLMADGSVSSGGGGATNLSPTQTATNFTINSDTGTDATIPLGNGTLAGGTLNNYTTAEKNKLAAITGTNTGDQNLQSVLDNGSTAGNANVILSSEGGSTLTLMGEGSGLGTSVTYASEEGGIAIRAINQTATAIRADGRIMALGGLGLSLYAESIDSSLTTNKDVDTANFVNNTLRDVDFLYDCSAINVNTITADGIRVYTNSGIGTTINQGSTGKGLVINSGTSSTGNFIELDKNGVDKLVVNQSGELTATKLIKQGGTSAQLLAANGDSITAGTNITISGGTISSTGGGVPYTGAVSDVNLGEFGIQLGNLEFDNTPTNIPTTAGSMYYNDTDGTLDLILKGGNVKLQIGQESVVRVVNKTATNIDLLEANYQAVRVTGAQGQRLKVDLAQATNDLLSAETIGLVTETIANNAEGFITTSGLVRNINTTGSLQSETWADGDVLYLSPTVAGQITKVKPTAPNHLIIIGYVISAHITQGTIFVKVDNGYELDELHNVKIDAVTNNEVLAYTSATDIWENKTPSEAGLQPTLVSATNIKTINGNTILGSGDLVISGTGISSLNGLTGATQTFSILTNFSGSPSFVSSGTNHQLRLPNAGPGTDYGLVTNGTQTFAGPKIFTSNPEIPVPAGNSGTCIVLGTTGGGGATGTLQIGSTTLYPTALEMQYVKGITSSVQTQLNGKATIVANIINNVYSGTIVWTGGAAPTVPNHTYSLSQIGNLVTLTINLAYTTSGSSLLTGVAMELPSTAPAPALPSSVTDDLDVINYGSGALQILNGSPTAAFATNTLLRIKSTGVYEVFITRAAGQYRHAYATIQYFV